MSYELEASLLGSSFVWNLISGLSNPQACRDSTNSFYQHQAINDN